MLLRQSLRGPGTSATLTSKPGFQHEVRTFDAPWGERLEAAWLVGPSVHGPASDHDHDEHGHEAGAGPAALDPVCGMTVVPETAREKGLHGACVSTDYFFCGKGCKLEFDEDPEHYLDPAYVPSM
jgi:YHS domain-containing protein